MKVKRQKPKIIVPLLDNKFIKQAEDMELIMIAKIFARYECSLLRTHKRRAKSNRRRVWVELKRRNRTYQEVAIRISKYYDGWEEKTK